MLDILEKEVFPYVDKPARYIGGEVNSIIKGHEGRTKLALIFPDVYEIGISNLGLKILYHILNKIDEIVCERAYAPWPDMEDKLRELAIPLYSLETKTPLNKFDILGFSFQYELLYTNFLNILNLSGIPFRTVNRGEDDPFIIGGGPVSGNLEPVAHFLDAICVGDGESCIVEITIKIREGRQENKSRLKILESLSEIKGVYVPSLYSESTVNGYVIPEGKKVRRRIEPDLEKIDFITRQIIPNVQAIQDRAVIEVARGCTRGCRFCQACFTYRPVRERSVATILKLARQTVSETGYRELSLISLSISDYSSLNLLINKLDEQFSPHGISFSLPSLRLDSFNSELAVKIKEIRKSGLTFAVEGGTQAVRDYINKGVNEDDLLSVINIAKNEGWKSVKLYFMIGLVKDGVAEETMGIAGLVKKISSLVPGIMITVSVAVFIPKPHTPFQRHRQLSAKDGKDEFSRLIDNIKKNKRINVRYNNPYMSYLEGIFSRGDRRLSLAIEQAYARGARFDGWNEKVNLALWEEAFIAGGIDPEFYLREIDADSPLPWDMIEMGASPLFLEQELERSNSGSLTKDCSSACEDYCGNCDFDEISPRLAGSYNENIAGPAEEFLPEVLISSKPLFLGRLLYAKKREMKYISPTDFEEIMSRALIRADIPVCYSSGFNPHIRVESMWALPAGFESDYEVLEIELSRDMGSDEFFARLLPVLPSGLQFKGLKIFPFPYTKINRLAKDHFISFDFDSFIDYKTVESKLAASGNYVKKTPKSEKIINLNDFVRTLSSDEGKIICDYYQIEGGARIQDIIDGITGYGVRKAVTLNPRVIERYILKNDVKISIFDV